MVRHGVSDEMSKEYLVEIARSTLAKRDVDSDDAWIGFKQTLGYW